MLGGKVSVKFGDVVRFLRWEPVNWGRAIAWWFRILNKCGVDWKRARVLEVGGGKGGELSLMFSKLGAKEVICSDIDLDNIKKAQKYHRNCGVFNIDYEVIDVLSIPYEGYFTVVAFKSLLGGVSRDGRDSLKYEAIRQIHSSLESRGFLLFAENLEGNFIHKFFRETFASWGRSWNYLKLNELSELLKCFSCVTFRTFGFLGNLAPYKLRAPLNVLDLLVDKFVPQKWNYIVSVVAKK